MIYSFFIFGFVCMLSDNGEVNWYIVGFFLYLFVKIKLIFGFGDLLRFLVVVFFLFINRLL